MRTGREWDPVSLAIPLSIQLSWKNSNEYILLDFSFSFGCFSSFFDFSQRVAFMKSILALCWSDCKVFFSMMSGELPFNPSFILAFSLRIIVSAIVLRYVNGRSVSGKVVSWLCSSFCLSPSITVLAVGSRLSEVRFSHHLSSFVQKMVDFVAVTVHVFNGFRLTTDLAYSRVSSFCVAFVFSYPVTAVDNSECNFI